MGQLNQFTFDQSDAKRKNIYSFGETFENCHGEINKLNFVISVDQSGSSISLPLNWEFIFWSLLKTIDGIWLPNLFVCNSFN